MIIRLRKSPLGYLTPLTGEDAESLGKFKSGEEVKADITRERNPKFHRKFFALLNVAFQLWEETGVRAEYKGEEVKPNIQRFRKDVTILAGHYHGVVNLRGEVRLEADSIAFGNMSEETFDKLYAATLTAIVHKVMKGRVSEERLRQMAEAVEEFA